MARAWGWGSGLPLAAGGGRAVEREAGRGRAPGWAREAAGAPLSAPAWAQVSVRVPGVPIPRPRKLLAWLPEWLGAWGQVGEWVARVCWPEALRSRAMPLANPGGPR